MIHVGSRVTTRRRRGVGTVVRSGTHGWFVRFPYESQPVQWLPEMLTEVG